MLRSLRVILPVVVTLMTEPLIGRPVAAATFVQPGCDPCEIDMTGIIELRTPNTGGQDLIPDPGTHLSIARDSRGRYYVAPFSDYEHVGVYGADGEFQRLIDGRTIGQPGGFFFVAEVKVHQDTLIVVDRGRRMLSFLPVEGGRPRSVSLGYGPEGILPLPGGRILTQSALSGPSVIGMPMHLHESDGEHIRTFGRSSQVISSSAPYDIRRHLAFGDEGAREIWVSWVNQYRLEKWALEGQLLDVIAHEREWFTPWSRYATNLLVTRAPTWFDSIRYDPKDGLLWCLFSVADRDWIPPGDPGREDVPTAAAPNQMNEVFDTVVEVLNASSGSIIASKRFDEWITGYLNGGQNLYVARPSPSNEEGSEEDIVKIVSFSLAPSR